MKLSASQRNYFFNALPKVVGDEDILVFEDDGGGWHHDPSVESWVSWSLISDGIRYLYNIRSCLSETWNADIQGIDDERGQLERGNVAIYVCSTDKKKVQAYASEIASLIDRTRLGLSLDYEGITTGPTETTSRRIGSYNDFRLKRRVYRTIIETSIIYKSVVIETPPLIKKISLEPWMGLPLAEMETLIMRAPMLLKADMLLAENTPQSLSASIVLN